MGLRYRKSINLGGGFRVNISKSGIGYSWGVKGARITKTARGTTRSTLSIPGTGISYVEETSNKKRKTSGSVSSNEVVQQHQNTVPLTQGTSTEIVNVDDYQPVEYEELLNSIKKVRNINLLSTILIWTFLLSAMPLFIFTGIAGIILKIYVHTKMGIPMEYEFDEESKEAYDNLCATWMSMNNNQKFWQIMSEDTIDKKVSGGANRGITRVPAKAINKTPFFIKPNVTPFGLQLKDKQLFFLPDKLLVISGTKVGAVNYTDIEMGLGVSHFVETDPVPKDAKIIKQTWLKVNKNGSPDKRFKDNRQVPVCEYGRVVVQSGKALYVELMCSNSATISEMEKHAKKTFAK